MTKKDDLLSEVDALVKKYEKQKEEKKIAKEKKKETELATKDDLQLLLEKMNEMNRQQQQPTQQSQMQQQVQPLQNIPQPQTKPQQSPQQPQSLDKGQIAYHIWKDAKATSIVCLIAIIMPMVTILVTMFKGGAMYAFLIAFAGMVYPCFVFVKMVTYQTRAYKKYGLKPLFQIPQQQIPQQNRMQQQPRNEGGML